MIIIDAHEDLAFNVLTDGRNYLESAYITRAREAGTSVVETSSVCMLGLPEWLRGNVAVIFATLTAIPRSRAQVGEPSYVIVEAAYQQAIAQLNLFNHCAATHPQITLITHQPHLDRVLKSWDPSEAQLMDKRKVGLVLLIENADLICTVDEVGFWYEQGVHVMGPAWHSNRYTASTNDSGTLTDLGRQLLAEMQHFGMILDLSHMAEEACFEALELYAGPVIASHSNPRRHHVGQIGMAVRDDWQGKGAGTALMQAAVDLATGGSIYCALNWKCTPTTSLPSACTRNSALLLKAPSINSPSGMVNL